MEVLMVAKRTTQHYEVTWILRFSLASLFLLFRLTTTETLILHITGGRRIPHTMYSISHELCTRFLALLCFVVVIHWLIFPYPSGLLHWHCGNLTIAPVPAKQPWFIWINTSCEFIMNDCITTTKQSTTKPCAYFLRYTVMRKAFPCHNVLKILIYYNHIADIHVTYI